ncbi:hypothetical protein FGO68_gene6187 [Halteria grandinella]|uniref:Uncharacterized protein n=1 Tax=Halteria grandinella TaxID=5974 RepID=A0A8J8N9V8_HALGN|nr:hypothetical protein FGO68_gene6187 [Halteria grandinella]
MELNLQFGYGMMEHCRHLTEQWNGGTTILSPRDLSSAQLNQLSQQIINIPNGKVLLDPQFYLPHSEHSRLCSHDYWPSDYQTGIFWEGQRCTDLINALFNINRSLGCSEVILPGLLATTIDDDWLNTQQAFIDEGLAISNGLCVLATIALSADATRNETQIARLMDASDNWEPHGYYIVCEHPNGKYLVDDPTWTTNIIDLAAGLKLRGKKVILGYCNHQMLLASVAKVDGIASGTWMNVRSFPPEKFRGNQEEVIRQRATWYYCPQALSEFGTSYLDLAKQQGVLDQMSPSSDLTNVYLAGLFSGAVPTSSGFTEQLAFRHYLHCLRIQSQNSVKPTFDLTVDHHQTLLRNARQLLSDLHTAGIKGQARDFMDSLDANESALSVIRSTRGPLLRRNWGNIQ